MIKDNIKAIEEKINNACLKAGRNPGDVKLMAVAGLFLGSKLALVALIAGCLYGSLIHIIRMKVSGEGKQLAMGPYLSAGIVTAMWFGNSIITW